MRESSLLIHASGIGQQETTRHDVLRWPASECDKLVHAWVAYMTAPEYQIEVKRSSKVDTKNPQAMADRESQRRRTTAMHKMRSEFNRMRRFAEEIESADPHRAEYLVKKLRPT